MINKKNTSNPEPWKNLIRLGVDQDQDQAFSRTRKGGWAIAQSPILNTTITLKRLKQRGYQSLTGVYIELNPSLCEPLGLS